VDYFFNNGLQIILGRLKGKKMKFKMLKAALACLVLSVSGFANAGLILQGNLGAVSSSTDEYANIAGLDWDLFDNGDGTITFNLTPTLFDNSPYLQALTVGIVNQAGTFSEDFTYGSSDGSTPDDELVKTGGVYSYTTGGLPTGELGMFLMVNGRAPDDGNDLQRWIGISSMSRSNDWGGFDWNWDNRIKFEGVAATTAAVPEPSTLAIFAIGFMGLASRRFKKQS
jgi:hypothetical protein